MKSFIAIAIIACLAAAAAAPAEENPVREERSPVVTPVASSYNGQAGPSYNVREERSYGSAPPAQSYSAPPPPSYGAAAAAAAAAPAYNAPAAPAPLTIPAPPCPKNYLFSCQPSLTPAPCAQAAYGGAGAYSHNYPVYAQPQFYNNYRSYY